MRFALCFLTAVTVSLTLPNALRAACSQLKPDATDAVAATPDHHKVILENDVVRVLDATAQPSHSIENLGKVMYQAYRVELKPTTKVAATKPVR